MLSVIEPHMGAADALQQQAGHLGLPVKLRLSDSQLVLRLRSKVTMAGQKGAPGC